MKRCPICDARVFEDMQVCFGCLYHFKEEDAIMQNEALDERSGDESIPYSAATGFTKIEEECLPLAESAPVSQDENTIACSKEPLELRIKNSLINIPDNSSHAEFAQRFKEIDAREGIAPKMRAQENRKQLQERLVKSSRLMTFMQSHPEDIAWKNLSLHVEKLGNREARHDNVGLHALPYATRLKNAQNEYFDLRAQVSCMQQQGDMTYTFGETITLWQLYEILGTISSQEDLDLDVRLRYKNAQENYCVSA